MILSKHAPELSAMRHMLAGRETVRVLAAMSPQQPDRLIRVTLEAAVEMGVRVTLMFADLGGRFAFLDEGMRPYVERGDVRLIALAGAVPKCWSRWVDYFPDSLWHIDCLLASGAIPVDIVLARVWKKSGGDGYDYGAMIGYTHAALATGARAAFEVAEPAIAGLRAAADISGGRAEFVCDAELEPEDAPAVRSLSDAEAEAGRYAASLLPENATLQIGLGAIADSMAPHLAGKQGLGLHSGIIPSSLRELICNGAIGGQAKAVDPGLAIATGVLGRDQAGANWGEKVELRPISQTHAPDRLSAQRRLWAVNSALEVDLSGQVNAEFAGDMRIASGGGQADFVRGARLGDGATMIVLTSRTRRGQGRIVSALPAGCPPTTPAQDVDYVVTEFGIAELRGRSMAERREALIRIAHPDDRAALAA